MAAKIKKGDTVIMRTGRDKGRVSLDNGYGNQGETIERRRDSAGKVSEIVYAGYKLLPEEALAKEVRKRYQIVGADGPTRFQAKTTVRRSLRAPERRRRPSRGDPN